MGTFFPFFITLLAGLIFSVTFRKVQIPWVVTLIISGIIIGPFGLDIFHIDQTVEFISDSGLVLLMFMAGLETRLSSFKKFQNKMYFLAFVNGFFPLFTGVAVASLLGYDIITATLVGIIFVSSSVAVVIPSLESKGLIKTPLGSSVLATSIVQDVASLVMLSLFLQSENNIANLPLIIFYPLVLAILILIRYFLPKIQDYIFKNAAKEGDFLQRDLRAILLILFGMVIVFELLGLHPIIAGFFTGLTLSESLKSKVLIGKIRAISYGIFIPMFFIVVGTETNIKLLFGAQEFMLLTIVIVVSSILSKFLSGSIAAKLVGFNKEQSIFFGVSSIPQLSTTLAATFTALELNLIGTDIVVAMVALSVISTIIGPILMALISKYILSTRDIKHTLTT